MAVKSMAASLRHADDAAIYGLCIVISSINRVG
jgi:hypothetical protein